MGADIADDTDLDVLFFCAPRGPSPPAYAENVKATGIDQIIERAGDHRLRSSSFGTKEKHANGAQFWPSAHQAYSRQGRLNQLPGEVPAHRQ